MQRSLTGEEQTTVGKMADDRLPKRAAELREQGRRRRRTQMLRWEDRVKRDVRKVGEEEDWKKKTREGWKRQSDEEVTSFGEHLTSDKGKERKRERIGVWCPNSVIYLIPS